MEETMERVDTKRKPGRPRMNDHEIHRVYIPAPHCEALRELAAETDRTQASLIREGVSMLLEKWSDKNR